MSEIISSSYVIDKYPTCCKDCPFYYEHTYKDNAYVGKLGSCDLGYMAKSDTREFNSSKLFTACNIQNDNRVHTSTPTCSDCHKSLVLMELVVSGDVAYGRNYKDRDGKYAKLGLYYCPECRKVYCL